MVDIWEDVADEIVCDFEFTVGGFAIVNDEGGEDLSVGFGGSFLLSLD